MHTVIFGFLKIVYLVKLLCKYLVLVISYIYYDFQALLEAKAFVNSKTKSGWTPLHFAAKNGHEGVVNYLVRKKAAVVDSMTMKKQTPLHLAATNGKLQVWSAITVKLIP